MPTWRDVAVGTGNPAQGKPRPAFVTFMESLRLDGIDITREVDRGSDVRLE
ncbi:hypothetical protein [Brucella intermedia]|uniref:hypothetical protein n=1 Tax=Brucella intermedia TaxID=94625 RepID=UPI00178C4697|nr:hypothetical protein [Brucella intermedia]